MAKTDRPLSAFERAVALAVGNGVSLGSPDDPLRQNCPALWAWLSTTHVGQDQVKTPATVTIRLGPGGALATLTDRDLCVSVDATAVTVEGLLQAMEAVLTGQAPPIKTWGKREPRLRKRRGQ